MFEKEKQRREKLRIKDLMVVTLPLLVLGLMIVSCPVMKAEEIGSSIYAGFNDHWGAEGNVKPPIIVTDTVIVEPNTKLVIDPGTMIIFTERGYIKVEKGGNLIAKGAKDNWIIFTSLEKLIYENDFEIIVKSGSATFEYCYFEDLFKIASDHSKMTMEYCYFKELSGIRLSDSKMTMEYCTLDKMKGIKAEFSERRTVIDSDYTDVEIVSNLFTGTKTNSGDYISLSLTNRKRPYTGVVNKNIFENNTGLNVISIDGSARISKNIIKNNMNSVGICVWEGKPKITDNLVTDNDTGIVVKWLRGVFEPNPAIKDNAIYNNSKYNLEWWGEQKLDILNNYWGSERPDVSKFKGNIDFSPWLKEFPAEVPTEEEIEKPNWDGLITTWTRMLEDEDERVRSYATDHLRKFKKQKGEEKEEKLEKIEELKKKITEFEKEKIRIEEELEKARKELEGLTSIKQVEIPSFTPSLGIKEESKASIAGTEATPIRFKLDLKDWEPGK
ncbi:hypothetical protein HQ584_02385 [Patescibacteria group bacterium]|nr:hypothetical protein [Patescibacteria group bacterium]